MSSCCGSMLRCSGQVTLRELSRVTVSPLSRKELVDMYEVVIPSRYTMFETHEQFNCATAVEALEEATDWVTDDDCYGAYVYDADGHCLLEVDSPRYLIICGPIGLWQFRLHDEVVEGLMLAARAMRMKFVVSNVQTDEILLEL
jgi:hypothetical protein